ncbi:MAG: hypothetical protein R3B96_02405 [Pirellulaceae bacterium]
MTTWSRGIRDWLSRRQLETKQGRAELRLEERAATWNTKPENRQLPSLWEYLSIRRFTDARRWTTRQTRMMRRATRVHAGRLAILSLLLVTVISIGAFVRADFQRRQQATRVEGLVGELANAAPEQLGLIIEKLNDDTVLSDRYLQPLLSDQSNDAESDRAPRLHARMARVSRRLELGRAVDRGRHVGAVDVRRAHSRPAPNTTGPSEASSAGYPPVRRRNRRTKVSRGPLVGRSGESEEPIAWRESDWPMIAEQLITVNPEFQPILRAALDDLSPSLVPELSRLYVDARLSPTQRLSAASALADYAAEDLERLADLLVKSTPEQFAVLLPVIERFDRVRVVSELSARAATIPPDELGSFERIAWGRERALAGIALARLGATDQLGQTFAMKDDPEAITQFVFACRPNRVSVDVLLDGLDHMAAAPTGEFPAVARHALLMAIGEYPKDQIPAARLERLVSTLANWYREDPSSGIHGAAGWLLRQWGEDAIVQEVDETPIDYSPDREWFVIEVPLPEANRAEAEELAGPGAGPSSLYLTFVVFPAGTYEISSLPDDPERLADEARHQVTITRPFALLNRELMFKEVIWIWPIYAEFMKQSDAQPEDAAWGFVWYEVAQLSRGFNLLRGLPVEQHPFADPDSLSMVRYPSENKRPMSIGLRVTGLWT